MEKNLWCPKLKRYKTRVPSISFVFIGILSVDDALFPLSFPRFLFHFHEMCTWVVCVYIWREMKEKNEHEKNQNENRMANDSPSKMEMGLASDKWRFKRSGTMMIEAEKKDPIQFHSSYVFQTHPLPPAVFASLSISNNRLSTNWITLLQS